ncbi:hypothetical protein D3C85_1798660 [compost metagenome]
MTILIVFMFLFQKLINMLFQPLFHFLSGCFFRFFIDEMIKQSPSVDQVGKCESLNHQSKQDGDKCDEQDQVPVRKRCTVQSHRNCKGCGK